MRVFVETCHVRSERAGVFSIFVVPFMKQKSHKEFPSRVNRSLSERTVRARNKSQTTNTQQVGSLIGLRITDSCHSNPVSHPGFDKIKI